MANWHVRRSQCVEACAGGARAARLAGVALARQRYTPTAGTIARDLFGTPTRAPCKCTMKMHYFFAHGRQEGVQANCKCRARTLA